MGVGELIDTGNIADNFSPVTRDEAGIVEVTGLAVRNAIDNYHTFSANNLKNDALEEQRRQIEEITGQDLFETIGEEARFDDVKRYEAVDTLLSADPERFSNVPLSPQVIENARERARLSAQDFQEATQNASGFDATVGGFVGGLGGGATDPVNIASMFVGAGVGKTLLQTVAIEAGINAGVETLTQPAIASWQRQIGEEYGFGEALSNIGFAALLGGGFAGVAKGAQPAASAAFEYISKAKDIPDAIRANIKQLADYAHYKERSPYLNGDIDGIDLHADNLNAMGRAFEARKSLSDVDFDVEGMSASRLQNFVTKELKAPDRFIGLRSAPTGIDRLGEIATRSENYNDFFDRWDAEIPSAQYDKLVDYYRKNFLDRAERIDLRDNLDMDIDELAFNMFKRDARLGVFKDKIDPNQLDLFADNSKHFNLGKRQGANSIPALFSSSALSTSPSRPGLNITSAKSRSGADSQSPAAASQRTGSRSSPETVFDTATISPLRNPGAVSIGRISPTSNYIVYQPTKNVNKIIELANKNKPELEKFLKDSVDGVKGAEFYGVRVKERKSFDDKVKGKSRDPDGIADALGGRIVVDNYEAMRRVTDYLRARARVIEVENKIPQDGRGKYRAVHMIVTSRNGLSAEIQIQPRPIREVQDEAHEIYKRWRDADASSLTKKQRKAILKDKKKSDKLFDNAWKKWQKATKNEKVFDDASEVRPLVDNPTPARTPADVESDINATVLQGTNNFQSRSVPDVLEDAEVQRIRDAENAEITRLAQTDPNYRIEIDDEELLALFPGKREITAADIVAMRQADERLISAAKTCAVG